MDAARTLVDELKEDPDVVGVFVGGSQLVGLGNTRSNLNVYVIQRSTDIALGLPDRALSTPSLDIERVALGRLEAGVDAVEQGPPPADDLTAFLRAAKSSHELLVRFFHSKTLFDTDDVLLGLRQRLIAAEDEMRQQLICWHALQCVNFRDDYAGATEVDDADTAEANSNRILAAALQAFLAGCGEYYIGEKWTWAKMRRTGAAPDLVQAARAAALASVRATTRRKARHRVELAQILLTAAITRGWDEPGAARWTLIPRSETVKLSHEWFPLRFGDRMTMDSIERQQTSISPQGVELWATSVTGGRKATVEQFAASHEVPPAEVETYLASLVDRGMLAFHE